MMTLSSPRRLNISQQTTMTRFTTAALQSGLVVLIFRRAAPGLQAAKKQSKKKSSFADLYADLTADKGKTSLEFKEKMADMLFQPHCASGRVPTETLEIEDAGIFRRRLGRNQVAAKRLVACLDPQPARRLL